MICTNQFSYIPFPFKSDTSFGIPKRFISKDAFDIGISSKVGSSFYAFSRAINSGQPFTVRFKSIVRHITK